MRKRKKSSIHPLVYIRNRASILATIKNLHRVITAWQIKALRHPFPANVRPMTQKDKKRGTVVWFFGDCGPMWQIIDDANYTSGAYVAEDGCMYHMEDGFIELNRKMTPMEAVALQKGRDDHREFRKRHRETLRQVKAELAGDED